MELKLKVLDGKHAGQEVPVPGNKFFIGRAEDCQLRPGSDLISRHHCVLLVDEGYVGVRDLGSKNGTYVNAELIVGEQQLLAGDRLKVGPLEFEITISTGVGGKKRPAVTGGVKEAAARATEATTTVGDVDVSQWLEADAASTTKPAPHVAQPILTSADTEEFEVGSTQEVNLAELEANAADSPTKADDAKDKKVPGKLPFQPPRAMAKDSRDAASKVLDMMRRRR